MDNLTHSLVGAILGQMGLKRKTGLAMPVLIMAANIPDVDAVAVLIGGHQHLAIRRGITHGPIAMAILPLILWAALLAWDKRRPSSKRPPVQSGWLLALCYIGTLSHPLFDWFNSYGIRLLSPFSNHWFYGDTLFIVDVWIWAALMAGVWISLRRERAGRMNWQRPARLGGGFAAAYIALNFVISAVAASWERGDAPYPQVIVANPVPVAFWRREVLWRTGDHYGTSHYSLLGESERDVEGQPLKLSLSAFDAAAKSDPEIAAFRMWSRLPMVIEERGKPAVTDQRFDNPLVRGRFTVPLPPAVQSSAR